MFGSNNKIYTWRPQSFVQKGENDGYLHFTFFRQSFNPFPHNKILDQTKLKAFADDKVNVAKMIISVFDRVENIVGKGEIACTRNCLCKQFPLFSTMLSKGFFPRLVKSCHSVEMG